MDFNIPMLETKFFKEEQAQMTCAAVKSFALWYDKKHSYDAFEKLCRDMENCNHKQLEKEKNAWLKSLGCGFAYRENGKIAFMPTNSWTSYTIDAGSSVDLVGDYEVDNGDVIWVWCTDAVKRFGYQEMVKGYLEIEPLREKDFAEAREFLKDYLPEKVEPIEVYLNFEESHTNLAGIYTKTGDIVLLMNWEESNYSFLHEYCHYLTLGSEKLIEEDYDVFEEWVAEWLTVYELKNIEKNKAKHFFVEQYRRLAKGHAEKNADSMSIPELEYRKFLEMKNDSKGIAKSYMRKELLFVNTFMKLMVWKSWRNW